MFSHCVVVGQFCVIMVSYKPKPKPKPKYNLYSCVYALYCCMCAWVCVSVNCVCVLWVYVYMCISWMNFLFLLMLRFTSFLCMVWQAHAKKQPTRKPNLVSVIMKIQLVFFSVRKIASLSLSFTFYNQTITKLMAKKQHVLYTHI